MTLSKTTRGHERDEAKYGCDLMFLLATEGLRILDTVGHTKGTARNWRELVTFMQECEQ